MLQRNTHACALKLFMTRNRLRGRLSRRRRGKKRNIAMNKRMIDYSEWIDEKIRAFVTNGKKKNEIEN